MFGTVSEEREMKVPASEAWKLFGTLELAKIVAKALPNFVRIDVVQGAGGAGTILELFSHREGAGLKSYKEKFMMVDDEKRVKVVEVVEGAYLDLGFTLYRVRFEVIEQEEEKENCITKATIEYEVREESVANAAFVSIQPLVAIMEAAALHLAQNYHNNVK